MPDISARDLRNHTAAVLRRVESGEHLTITVSRRPVAEIVPLGRRNWIPGAAMERIIRESPADPGLLDDIAFVRDQVLDWP